MDALPAPGHRAERRVRHLGERPDQYVLPVAFQPAEVRGVALGREDQEPLVGLACWAKWVSMPWIACSAPPGLAGFTWALMATVSVSPVRPADRRAPADPGG